VTPRSGSPVQYLASQTPRRSSTHTDTHLSIKFDFLLRKVNHQLKLK